MDQRCSLCCAMDGEQMTVGAEMFSNGNRGLASAAQDAIVVVFLSELFSKRYHLTCHNFFYYNYSLSVYQRLA